MFEGLSLEHNINEKGNSGKTFDQNLIFDWMKDIIKGLSYLHDKLQIIHRDIKPG
jgi:serine/threonine protein kinase